jgi:cob(I)alamin adenosyltransferase
MSFKIYTKTGDLGETGIFGGRRLSKAHVRIDAYGTVDELNAHLGLVRDNLGDERQREVLLHIQNTLFSIGSNLASDPSKDLPVPEVKESSIEEMEQEIDRMTSNLPELRNFILPGGHRDVSQCHVARCVCRRAERLVVALSSHEPVDAILVRYLNRLSDYLFTLCRQIAQDLGVEEVKWVAPK